MVLVPVSISNSEPRPGYVAVGRVQGTWGIHGALRVQSLTDFPDRFTVGATLWLGDEPHRVERSHIHRGAVIVKLSGLDDPDVARSLRGSVLEVPESELHELGEDEYYQHDLIGLHVLTTAGEEIGRVTELLPTGANDVLVVRGERGEYLLPLIADVVRAVDLAAGQVSVELLPGLEPMAPRPPRRKSSGQ